MKLLLIYELFLAYVAKIRARFGVPIGGFSDSDKGKIWDFRLKTESLELFFKYRNFILAMIHKYRLPLSFEGAISRYIRTGQKPEPRLLAYDVTALVGIGEWGAVEVRIYQPPTKKDWAMMKKEVEDLTFENRGKKQVRSRKRMNIDRDIAILRNGKSMADLELADSIFATNFEDDECDISVAADRRRMQRVRQARHRIRKALKEQFE